ncbi:MAG TPA: VWA domain-containing protein [Thermoanaerobaculia bacterium]|nr:VWA domain-containing protein [Thermoanaerobaculia bacterium]
MLCTVALHAQVPPFGANIEVRVVNVDVVVTDRAGNLVHNLTQDDFEVLDEGVAQTITNFSEIRPPDVESPKAAAVPEARPRAFVLFIDSASLPPVARRKVLEALTRFIDEQLGPGDQASVVEWGRSLTIAAPLTSDKAILRQALADAGAHASPASAQTALARVQRQCSSSLRMAMSGALPMRIAYEECIGYVRQETQALTLASRSVLSAVDVALTTVAGVDAKKALIVAGAELPADPGADLFQWANDLFARYTRGFGAAHERPDGDVTREQHSRIEELAHRASTRGVTLYLVAGTATSNPNDASATLAVHDSGADFQHKGNTRDAFASLARESGGFAVPTVDALDRALDAIARETASYYAIGYRPGQERRGDRHIVVRTKKKEYVVRARRTYAQPTVDEEVGDRVTANVFREDARSAFAVRIRAGQPQRAARGQYTVPVEIVFPSSLTLLPDGEQLAGGFVVYVSVGNDSGALSGIQRRMQPVRMAKGEEKTFRAEPVLFTATLTMREGENRLSVAVRDQVSNEIGFARATIVAK